MRTAFQDERSQLVNTPWTLPSTMRYTILLRLRSSWRTSAWSYGHRWTGHHIECGLTDVSRIRQRLKGISWATILFCSRS